MVLLVMVMMTADEIIDDDDDDDGGGGGGYRISRRGVPRIPFPMFTQLFGMQSRRDWSSVIISLPLPQTGLEGNSPGSRCLDRLSLSPCTRTML